MLVTRPNRDRTRDRAVDDDRGAALISVLIVSLVLGVIAVGLSSAVVNTTLTTSGVTVGKRSAKRPRDKAAWLCEQPAPKRPAPKRK